jgi:hypothetical protein
MINGFAYSQEQLRRQRERAAAVETAAAAAVADRTVTGAIMGWTPGPIAPMADHVRALSPLGRRPAALPHAA